MRKYLGPFLTITSAAIAVISVIVILRMTYYSPTDPASRPIREDEQAEVISKGEKHLDETLELSFDRLLPPPPTESELRLQLKQAELDRQRQDLRDRIRAETIEESVVNLLYEPVSPLFAMSSLRSTYLYVPATIQFFLQDPRSAKLHEIATDGNVAERQRLLVAIADMYLVMLQELPVHKSRESPEAPSLDEPYAAQMYPVLAGLMDTDATTLPLLVRLFDKVEADARDWYAAKELDYLYVSSEAKQLQAYGAMALLDHIASSQKLKISLDAHGQLAITEYEEYRKNLNFGEQGPSQREQLIFEFARRVSGLK